MSQELYLGADCGESKHHFALHNASGERLLLIRIPNTEEALYKGLGALAQQFKHATIHLVVESLYGFSARLVEVGRDLGFTLWKVNAKALKSFRDLEGQPRKTDDIDASLLARMACLKMRGCRLAAASKPEEQALRRLGRLHEQVTERLTATKFRLRSTLLELCPEVVRSDWAGPSYSSQAFIAVLERWPGFEGLERAHSKSIEAILKSHRTRPAKRPEQVEALKSLARRLPDLREEWTLGLSLFVDQFQLLDAQLKKVDALMLQKTQEHPIGKKLMQMPGVGLVTSAVAVGELLPLVRTSKESEVATYAGLTPLARRSSKGGKEVMSRGTNKHVLRACFMSALASTRSSSLDRAYYEKQRRQHCGHPKEHVVATIALARQRHKLMYKLMKTDAEYDKEILIRSHLARQERESRAA